MYVIEITIETENRLWGESFENCTLKSINSLLEHEIEKVSQPITRIDVLVIKQGE